MKKNDYVSFKFQDQTLTGLIVKGGKTLTVRYARDGAVYQIKNVDTKYFTVVEAPSMDTSTAMDGYSTSGFKDQGGEETMRFQCKLLKDGKHITDVSNGGYGGCNEYHSSLGSYEEIKQFHAAAKQWTVDHGVELCDAGDTWLDWYNVARLEFVTADDYLNDFKEMLSAHGL